MKGRFDGNVGSNSSYSRKMPQDVAVSSLHISSSTSILIDKQFKNTSEFPNFTAELACTLKLENAMGAGMKA